MLKAKILFIVIAIALFLNISVFAKTKCMFVAAVDPPSSSDKVVIDKIGEWGYEVTVVLSSDLVSLTEADYAKYDFIFASESVSSSSLQPLKLIPKPLLCSEGWASKPSALAWCDSETAENFAPEPVVIVEGAKDHALAAGYKAGDVLDLCTDTNGLIVPHLPTIEIIQIAVLKSDPKQSLVYGVEKGTVLTDGNITENRAAMVSVHEHGYPSISEAGWAFYKAAINWILEGSAGTSDAAGKEAGKTEPVATASASSDKPVSTKEVEKKEPVAAASDSSDIPKIIYVTEALDRDKDGANDDIGWYCWLKSEGYFVDYRPGYWNEPLDAQKIAELEAADLIIVGRGANTGSLDQEENPKWNGITTPLLLPNCLLARRYKKWGWTDSYSNQRITGAPKMKVIASKHPIFKGIRTRKLLDILDPKAGSGITAFLTEIPNMGNGKLLAETVGDVSTVWIAEWKEGVEYYKGSGQIAGGHRMMFVVGTQDRGSDDPVGILNLTDKGKKLFLNAVKYMLNQSAKKK
jgi:hypothetical protein